MQYPLGMTSNQYGNLVQMSKQDTKKKKEALEPEIRRVETNLKNPMRKAEQEQEDCGHAVYRIGCSVCIRGRCVEKHCRIEPLKEEEKGAKLPLVSFNHVFSTQEKADMFSILIRRMIPETLCSWEPTLEERGGFLGMTTRQMFTEDVVWIASASSCK